MPSRQSFESMRNLTLEMSCITWSLHNMMMKFSRSSSVTVLPGIYSVHIICPICQSRLAVASMASRRIRDLAKELSEVFDRTRDSLDLQNRGELQTVIDWKPYFEFIF
jgi:hypothetical protein